jgi:hypothetical protein
MPPLRNFLAYIISKYNAEKLGNISTKLILTPGLLLQGQT